MARPYEIGDVVNDTYHVISVLGDGGMGVVYGVVDVTGQWCAALKVLRREFAHDARVVERFHREALLSAKLKSWHVARVYDGGRTKEGLPFIVMEYLEGWDLEKLLQHYERIQPSVAVGWVMQACNAVAEAHTHGIIHRDIKPSNLFLATTEDGGYIIKVLDFGIGKLRDGSSNNALTRPGDFCGTILYMAPEQAKSAASADHRADVWSIGMVLYELISGKNPILKEDVMKTFLALATGDVPPLGELANVPEGLAEVVHRCLRRKPEERYQNVGMLALDLAPFAR